jgi:hypothetical protein
MPAALWNIAEGSEACAVNAPANPMARAPCSEIAKPPAAAEGGASAKAAAATILRGRGRSA